MDPEAADVDQGAWTLGALLRTAGVGATLALLAGVVVLVLAVRHARRRGTTAHALGLFAAAWLAFVPVLGAGSVSGVKTFLAITLRWGDPGADRIAPYLYLDPSRPAVDQVCAAGLLLGLAGAVVALARSRPDGPMPAADSPPAP